MRKSILLFTTAILSIIVPLPSRFAYTVVMIFAINFIMLTCTTLKFFIRKLDLAGLESMLLLVFMFAMTILFKQLVILFSPVIALTMGFVIYLAPVSSFMTGHILEPQEKYEGNIFAINMRNSGILTLIAVLVSFLREMLAFGSFSLPFPDGIHVYDFPLANSSQQSLFFSTIPGAFIIIGLIFAVVMFINRKIENSSRKE